MASQITDNSVVCSTAYSSWQQRKHQSSAFLSLCEKNPPVIGGFQQNQNMHFSPCVSLGQLYHHDSHRCPDTELAPGHQQPPCCLIKQTVFEKGPMDFLMSCRDFTTWQGTRIVVSEMAVGYHIPTSQWLSVLQLNHIMTYKIVWYNMVQFMASWYKGRECQRQSIDCEDKNFSKLEKNDHIIIVFFLIMPISNYIYSWHSWKKYRWLCASLQ